MRKLMCFALPFGAGCLLCLYLLPEGARVWTAAGALALALLMGGRRKRRPVRIGAAGLAAGVLWFSVYAALYLAPAQELVGSEGVFEMELLDYPEESGYGARCAVRVSGLRGRAVYYGGGELLDLVPGTRLTGAAVCYSAAALSGEESSYYLSQGVFLRLYGKGEVRTAAPEGPAQWRYLPARMNRRLRDAVDRLYDRRAGGLITALLTGERDGLDEQSYSDLREAGLLHLTAVSGLHCTFLVGLLGLLMLRRQRLTALAGYPALLFYMVMVGCSPSVVRACIMAGFALLAPLAGREGDAPTSLSAALLVILLANPFAAGSVSLQLSFAAVAGLLGPARRIYAVLMRFRPGGLGAAGGKLWRFALSTVSASLGIMALTTPLSAAYFGAVSLVSPVSNLLVLWMAPALFACALTGTAACALLPALAPLAAVPGALARYLLWVAERMAKLPGHGVYVTGPVVVLWLLLVYTMLAICALSRDGRRKWAAALALSAVCLAAVKALPRLTVRNDALTVVAVDVGQGAATLLHAGESAALVDCGSLGNPRGAGEAVAVAMDAYGWSRLDYVALTHYHADHAGGLASLLARVEVGELLLPRLLENGEQADLQREVLALAAAYGVGVRYVESPEETALGSATLTVYPPVSSGEVNEEGLTILCSAGAFDLLITGDMNAATEEKLIQTYALPDIEVYMAGHHGSRHSTSRALLEAAAPEVGIISVGQNTFGHPTAEAMGRMALAGMTLYRTDWQGNILIRVLGDGAGAAAEGRQAWR